MLLAWLYDNTIGGRILFEEITKLLFWSTFVGIESMGVAPANGDNRGEFNTDCISVTEGVTGEGDSTGWGTGACLRLFSINSWIMWFFFSMMESRVVRKLLTSLVNFSITLYDLFGVVVIMSRVQLMFFL